MAPLPSEFDLDKDEGDGDMTTPMAKLAELEARMAIKDSTHDASIRELRAMVEAFRNDMAEALELSKGLKNFFRFMSYVEKFLVFTAKLGGAVAIIYAGYKFGIQEIVEKVKTAGGK